MLLDDVRIQWKQAQQEANSIFPKYGIQIYIPLAIVIVSAIFEIIFFALNNTMVALPLVFINWGALICLSVQYRYFKRNNAAAIAAYERKMRSTFRKNLWKIGIRNRRDYEYISKEHTEYVAKRHKNFERILAMLSALVITTPITIISPIITKMSIDTLKLISIIVFLYFSLCGILFTTMSIIYTINNLDILISESNAIKDSLFFISRKIE